MEKEKNKQDLVLGKLRYPSVMEALCSSDSSLRQISFFCILPKAFLTEPGDELKQEKGSIS